MVAEEGLLSFVLSCDCLTGYCPQTYSFTFSLWYLQYFRVCWILWIKHRNSITAAWAVALFFPTLGLIPSWKSSTLSDILIWAQKASWGASGLNYPHNLKRPTRQVFSSWQEMRDAVIYFLHRRECPFTIMTPWILNVIDVSGLYTRIESVLHTQDDTCFTKGFCTMSSLLICVSAGVSFLCVYSLLIRSGTLD